MELLTRLGELLQQYPNDLEDHGHSLQAWSQAWELEDALADAHRIIVTTGAKPTGVLHGSPSGDSEELMEACQILNVPYQSRFQTDAHIVKVFGELDDPTRHTEMALTHDGDLIYLLGPLPKNQAIDFKVERLMGDIMIAASRDGLLNAAYAVTELGFLVSLSRMAIAGNKGARFWIPDGVSVEDALFSSAPGRIICVVPRSEELRFSDMCIARNVPLHRIGVVDGHLLELQDHFAIAVADLA